MHDNKAITFSLLNNSLSKSIFGELLDCFNFVVNIGDGLLMIMILVDPSLLVLIEMIGEER